MTPITKKNRRSSIKYLKKGPSCDVDWTYLALLFCNLVCLLVSLGQVEGEIGLSSFISMLAFVVVRFLWVLPGLSLYDTS